MKFYRMHFTGALDVSRYPEFRFAFTSAPPDRPVLIDLTDVEIVDSTFLSEALLFKRRHPQHVATMIRRGSDVERVFDIANIRTKIAAFHTESDALASLEPASREARDGFRDEWAGQDHDNEPQRLDREHE